MLETVGLDWRLLDRYVERIRAVTAAQVQQVARKYLTESNMTVTVLQPQAEKAGRRAPRPAGGAHVR
jgi:zinc protease